MAVGVRFAQHLLGGRGGIRTPETLAGLAVFKTAAIDHSATLPFNDLECIRRCWVQDRRLRPLGHPTIGILP